MEKILYYMQVFLWQCFASLVLHEVDTAASMQICSQDSQVVVTTHSGPVLQQ